MGETEGMRAKTANELWAQTLLRLMPGDYPEPDGVEVTALGSAKREYLKTVPYIPQEAPPLVPAHEPYLVYDVQRSGLRNVIDFSTGRVRGVPRRVDLGCLITLGGGCCWRAVWPWHQHRAKRVE